MKTSGCQKVFSNDLAEAIGANSSQVRKDFSLFGISGNKRGGYGIHELMDQLDTLFNKNQMRKIIVVGVGNIGRALMNYESFARELILIEAAFDIDPMKYDREALIPVLPMEELQDYITHNKIKMAIIAVPYFAAQQVFDLMSAAGIRGVVNFSPVSLKTPEDVFVNNVNVQLEIDIVHYFVNALDKKE